MTEPEPEMRRHLSLLTIFLRKLLDLGFSIGDPVGSIPFSLAALGPDSDVHTSAAKGKAFGSSGDTT
jgi:hypothetical protein